MIIEKVQGAEHPDVASALDKLASFYEEQDRNAEAEPLLKRSLAINERALASNDHDLAWSFGRLGDFYKSEGRLQEAQPLLERSYAIVENQEFFFARERGWHSPNSTAC